MHPIHKFGSEDQKVNYCRYSLRASWSVVLGSRSRTPAAIRRHVYWRSMMARPENSS